MFTVNEPLKWQISVIVLDKVRGKDSKTREYATGPGW